MFSIQKKIDDGLKIIIDGNYCKNVRVIIKCNSFLESIEKKISPKSSLIWVLSSINCICCNISISLVQRLSEYPQVSFICEDTFAQLCGVTDALSSAGLSSETAYKINLHNKYRLTGKNIGIGIIDSGVYPHSDFLIPSNKIARFEDYVNNFKYPYDDHGHGTALCGIICGSGELSKDRYKGIAENSHIYCIKAFNSIGKGYISDILHAFENILNSSSELNIKVICLPFETLGCNNLLLSLFKDLFEKASKANITVVVPTGHNGNYDYSIRGIATLQNCITVGGLDTVNGLKPYIYSSYGMWGKNEKPDMTAPCVNLVSCAANTKYISERSGSKVYPPHLENPYILYTGTSVSAAYITGVCALLYENNETFSTRDILSRLKTSCKLLEITKLAQGAGTPSLDNLLL